MKTKLLRHALLAFFLWFVAVICGFAQAAKIAVIGDPSLGNLVDLTTAQLSSVADLSVLERADMDKIGHEQALKDMVGSNDLASVQFVPADGLVILREVKQGGKTGIFARLVAVQPGIVLREAALSDGTDVTAQASEIAKDFAPYWAKLGEIQRGKVNALSLLGLRFELDAPESREMERKINVLLASRLSAEPDTVVLERWRLNDALFEKTLQAQPSSAFWTGSSLIDGSMTWQASVIAVKLRVRPPNGAEVSIEDEDSTDHLPALIERLAAKIQSHPMTAGTWQPAAEAEHYAQLGKWCLDNRLTEQGAEAIESARALGDDSPATLRLQVQAYRSLTFRDELPDSYQVESPYVAPMDPASLPDRMKWGATAADLAGHYFSANANFSGQPGASDDPVTLCLPVVDNCLRLLLYAYAEGYAWDHPDETADLRHKVEGLMAQMEPVVANRPSEQRVLFLEYQLRYTPFWHETPEATVGFYRDLLNRKTDGLMIRKAFFAPQYDLGHPSVFLPLKQERAEHPGDSFPIDWYSGSPRIMSWEDRPSSELRQIWQSFANELSASPDAVLRSDALKFELGAERDHIWSDYEPQDGQILAFLQQNQDSLVGERGNEILTGLQWTYFEVPGSPHPRLDALRAFGAEMLNKRVVLPSEWVKRMPSMYRDIPPNVAQTLLARLDAYRQWYRTQNPQDPDLVAAMERARRPLAAYASAGLPVAGGNAVVVSHRWPTQGFGADILHTSIFSPSFTTAENKALFMMFGGKLIHCIDPANFQNDAVFTVPPELIGDTTNAPGGVSLGLTPQYLVVCVEGRVLLCSRADNTWRKLDLPPSDYKPSWINQQLYLVYDVEADMIDAKAKDQPPSTAISGIIRVSLPDGGIENLVSTHRIPPQSPLDGKPFGFPIGLWDSPAGMLMAVHAESPQFQIYGASPGENNWAMVASDAQKSDVKGGAGGLLIGKGFDEHGFVQLSLFDGKDSEVLLSNPNRAPAGTAARWNLPDDVRAIPQDVYWQAGAAMRGDDLCFYRNVMNDTSDGFRACLYYYSKGQKDAVRIPLKFFPPANEITALVKNAPTVLNFKSVQATDYGLVIDQAMGGFWVIPWTDIDSFRADAASTHVATVSPVPSELPAVPAPPTPPVMAPAPVVAAPVVVAQAPMVAAPPPQAAVAPVHPAAVVAPKPSVPPMPLKVVLPVTPVVSAPVLAPAPAPSVPVDNRD